MAFSEQALNRLAGQWGSYDFWLIRDRHFLTASDMVERFLEKYQPWWERSGQSADAELASHPKRVRKLITEWAERKVASIIESDSAETIRTHIMFKQLHYGKGRSINFGSVGANWKKKTDIAKELSLYRPWSVAHAAAVLGNTEKLWNHMNSIVEAACSPSETRFFEGWRELTNDTDRPMLFPQVHGHTSGKFWLPISKDDVIALHFDFGLINVEKRRKALVECDSRRYHSDDKRYQSDRDRQNVAEREGWSVRRFTYEDIMKRLDRCFENLEADLYY
jgi:hypothetical protein